MRTILFHAIGIFAAVGLSGCASTVTEGPRRDPHDSQQKQKQQASSYRKHVEEPAPVAIPQKPGTTTEPNYLRQNSPDEAIYTRSQ